MAKVLYGGGVAEMRGSEAGTTHSRNKGGSYTRQRVTPVNPQTAAQTAARSRITQLSSQWSNLLTQAQRDAWTIFGQNFPSTDVFGLTVQLTGLQAYTRINSRLMAGGFSQVASAPADQNVTDLVSASAVLTGGVDYVLTFSPTPVAADDAVQVWATPGLSQGITYAKHRLRLVSTSPLNQATGYDFRSDYVSVFGGDAPGGSKVIMDIRSIRSVNGAVDQKLRISATVA